MWQRGKVSIKNVFLGLRFFFSNESETKKIFSSRSSKMLLLLLRSDGGILEMKLMTSRDLTQKYLYQWPVFDWFLDRGTKMVMIEAQWWCQELHCNWDWNWLLKDCQNCQMHQTDGTSPKYFKRYLHLSLVFPLSHCWLTFKMPCSAIVCRVAVFL